MEYTRLRIVRGDGVFVVEQLVRTEWIPAYDGDGKAIYNSEDEALAARKRIADKNKQYR